MKQHHWIGLLCALVTALVFSGVTGHGFLPYDDDLHVYDNPAVVNPDIASVADFWRAPQEGLYIPLTYSVWAGLAGISRALTAEGGELLPAIFHGASLSLHVLAVVLVFSLLRLLTGSRPGAAAGALLFALHPVQVEAVAWVSELKGLLAGCLGLLALWQYTRYGSDAGDRAKSGRPGYLLATVWFGLALLSKPAAVAVPLLGVVISRLLLRRSLLRTVAEMGPWLLVALPVLIVTKTAQPDAAQTFVPGFVERLLIAGDAVSFYLYKFLLPFPLGIDYGRSPAAVLDRPWIYLSGILPWLALALLALQRPRPALLAPVLIFLGSLLPVLGLVGFDFQHISTVADRYLYLALLGPALAVSMLVARHGRGIVYGFSAFLIVVYAVLSIRQIGVWRDAETLFRHALTVNDQSWLAHDSLGLALRRQGRLPAAIEHYNKALALRPDYGRAHLNIGVALLKQDRIADALAHLRESVRLAPDDASAHGNLGVALGVSGDLDAALVEFRRAVSLAPDSAAGHANLANALMLSGRRDEAAREYRKALAIDPGLAAAREGLRALGQ